MKWINPDTGELERRPPGMLYEFTSDYNPLDPEIMEHGKTLMTYQEQAQRVPSRIERWLEKSRLARWGDAPLVKASSVSWRDMLTPRRVMIADGAQVLNTTTETIMVPDFTFAADYMEIGDAFKYTLFFDWSSVITTPGTATFRLRWGGVAGTPILAASGAYAPDPTAAGTTISGWIEYYLVCRATGTAGSFFCMGRMNLQDFDDATATTLKGNLDMGVIPVSAPAAATSADTTTAKALSPTVAFSVATATTQLTNHLAFLESLN